MATCIYEIRDYTIEGESFDAYAKWATELAVPWLSEHLDVVGFWMDAGIDAEVAGSAPVVSPNGQANVTWILRWPDKATRDTGFAAAFGSDGWKAVWAAHPNANAYLHTNARFMEQVI
ncbi:MAG TPA: hypothetical protein VLA56_06205 [Pseudomonadales bacterium]|nr:hypothetical protein [Pseudomonadales bacterium]